MAPSMAGGQGWLAPFSDAPLRILGPGFPKSSGQDCQGRSLQCAGLLGKANHLVPEEELSSLKNASLLLPFFGMWEPRQLGLD